MTNKKRVSYFYHPSCPLFYYGPSHPMKPHRLKLAHHLILSYGLYKQMDCYRPHPAAGNEMSQFHADDYIEFLRKATSATSDHHSSSNNSSNHHYSQLSSGGGGGGGGSGSHAYYGGGRQSQVSTTLMQRYNAGDTTDCPIFDGLYEFCQLYSGASLDGAVLLCQQHTDIAINWSGGLHHAKKSEASGFCYVNDIVLAIIELLKVHARVLYIDIDVHHGDGVEEAFYTTDRVMTFSVHKYGDFFPGTGHSSDVGAKEGAGYSVNAPLNNGITDDTYFDDMFQPLLAKIMEVFQPGAIVLQCGADSLTGDRLGCFNLTLKGHARCVQYVKSFNVPLLVLGGGGYTIRNVARCWAYETAVLLDQPDISNDIPFNDYYEYYAPDYTLHLTPEPMENLNSKSMLESVRIELLQQLQDLQGAPSVAMHEVPPLFDRKSTSDTNASSSYSKKFKKSSADDSIDRPTSSMDADDDDDKDDERQTKTTKSGEGVRKEHEAELYDKVD